MDDRTSRRRLLEARVARLASVRAGGSPHIVPVCFAVLGATIVTAVDDTKPKSTPALRRLANIRANPQVCLLVDHYDDDWQHLWWVRADGTARVEPMTAAYERALATKYEQYAAATPAGPAIVIEIARISGWSFAGG